jgi:protein-disulfide isomerase
MRSSRSPGPTSLTVLVALVLGALLMCGGVGALFAYQLTRNRRAVFAGAAPSAASPVPSGSAPGAGPDSQPPMANEDPPEEAEPDPELEQPSAKPELPGVTAPERAARGVARVQTEDAASPLPLDSSVPVWGSRDALVTVLVFGDLECPHTRKSLSTLRRLRNAFKSELRIAWRHRPLPDHVHARPAAEFAARVHLSSGPDAFWSLIEQAAGSSAAPTEAELMRWRGSADVPKSQKSHAADAKLAAERVSRDLDLAGRYDVRSTPTFFINGTRVEGTRSYAQMRQLIDAERKASRFLLAQGIARSELYSTRAKKNLINVGPDVIERTCPKIAGSPVRGAPSAPVTLVEFSDFECEYCKRAQPSLSSLLARYGKDLRLVWKNFPLEQHTRARAAAALAVRAYEERGERGFWQVHDDLFLSAPDLGEATLLRIAKRASLNPEAARDALRLAERNTSIARDVALGEKLEVSGTPTFFINGRRLAGARAASEFRAVIEEELSVARRLIAAGTPLDKVYSVLCGSP